MTSILAPENVILDATAASQAEVFDLIAAKAVALGITSRCSGRRGGPDTA
jgi:mannitol/fructose-specific phosphotransferase system IIA component (Ntr-type)